MTITLAQIKRTVADIKEDFYEGNDSHSHAEYRGVCEGLDMLVRHFTECPVDAMEKVKAILKYSYKPAEEMFGNDEDGGAE